MGRRTGEDAGELKKAADVESEKVVPNADRMAAGMVEAAKLAAEQEVRKAKVDLEKRGSGIGHGAG